jgi:hypothetical protein
MLHKTSARVFVKSSVAVALLLSGSRAFATDAWTGGTNLLYDSNASVKVGVRTSGPKNALDVKGAAVIGSSYGGTNTAPTDGLIVQGNVGAGTTTTHNRLDVKGAAAIGSTYGGTNTAPTDGLIVQGAVGVGTSAPTTGMMLHVVGNAFVSGSVQANGGLKINTWSLEAPDYVFDPARFKLRSLGDLEQFLKENRHLPEMPSAGEMKRDGVDVADMDMRLLKKVEELTLYVIQQDKKIARQEKKIRELTAKAR